mgnify:FL=1
MRHRKSRSTAVKKGRVAALSAEVARLKEREMELEERLAVAESLPQIADRQSFEEARIRLDKDPSIIFIMFDANNFGMVNKIGGHDLGNKGIDEISLAIRSAVQRSPHASTRQIWRIGGDEFVVAVKGSYHAAHELALDAVAEYGHRSLISSSGEVVVISIEHGIGPTFCEADQELRRYKDARRASDMDTHYIRYSVPFESK